MIQKWLPFPSCLSIKYCPELKKRWLDDLMDIHDFPICIVEQNFIYSFLFSFSGLALLSPSLCVCPSSPLKHKCICIVFPYGVLNCLMGYLVWALSPCCPDHSLCTSILPLILYKPLSCNDNFSCSNIYSQPTSNDIAGF